MKTIVRERYLERIKALKDTSDIKIITGIIHPGKSNLMQAYIGFKKSEFEDVNIIFIDFMDQKFEKIKKYHALHKYVEDRYDIARTKHPKYTYEGIEVFDIAEWLLERVQVVLLFNEDAFRVAIINAFVHNQWITGNVPMISVFSDRIEILSRGKMPPGQTMEGFFARGSVPVNQKFSDIFLQLHISERTGRGVLKITEVYSKETYKFRENSIVVSIPFTGVNVDMDTQDNTYDEIEKTYDNELEINVKICLTFGVQLKSCHFFI